MKRSVDFVAAPQEEGGVLMRRTILLLATMALALLLASGVVFSLIKLLAVESSHVGRGQVLELQLT